MRQDGESGGWIGAIRAMFVLKGRKSVLFLVIVEEWLNIFLGHADVRRKNWLAKKYGTQGECERTRGKGARGTDWSENM